MFWLGLASMIDAPGFLRASIPFGWAILSALLPLALWRKGEVTFLHWALAGFLLYALTSILWTPWWQDGVWAVWQFALFGLAFWLGSTLSSTRSILLGAAIGLWISSAAAIAQVLGDTTLLFIRAGAGLFYSPILSGETAALVILGLVAYEEWWYILGVAPLLILSQSRGAWLALGFGLIAHYGRSWWLLAGTVFGSLAAVLVVGSPHDTLRIGIWTSALDLLRPFGWGAGSFLALLLPGIHPEYAHNDFLQLAFEYGLGAAPLLLLLALCAIRRTSREWPIYMAFLFMACFSFPFYMPTTLFLGALCAGRLARDWAGVSSSASEWGYHQLLRGGAQPSLPSCSRSKTLPIQLGT